MRKTVSGQFKICDTSELEFNYEVTQVNEYKFILMRFWSSKGNACDYGVGFASVYSTVADPRGWYFYTSDKLPDKKKDNQK